MISKSCDCRIVFRILQAAFLPTHRGIHVCCLICNLTLHISMWRPSPPGQKGGIPRWQAEKRRDNRFNAMLFDRYAVMSSRRSVMPSRLAALCKSGKSI